MLAKNILEKYNIPVPRYTSYPPANYFHEGFSSTDLLIAIEESNELKPSNLSFYFHIPFCKHHCTYCGCNAYAMANNDGIDAYMKALNAELQRVLPLIDSTREISQIHFGGGSPTSISVYYLKEIISILTAKFKKTVACEIAIECHPGYLTMDDWANLVEAGFNRCSIGIQDFDEKVLKTVNRRPSKEDPSQIVAFLKSKGVSVNLDFIYGLPHQTEVGFTETIRKACLLKPDRLVTFSYAHVPWVHPIQKALEKHGLPESNIKTALYEGAVKVLLAAGYLKIGMDHFVLPNDELDLAAKNNKLHRNFQGYCTWETTGQVYAFGVTAISQLTTVYAQNTKSIADYIEMANKAKLPVCKGYRLTKEQILVREVITSLMCNGTLNWEAMKKHVNFESVEMLKETLSYPLEKLQEMAEDGILELSDNALTMTNDGSRFVRNVAALFDPLFKEGTTGYSLPV